MPTNTSFERLSDSTTRDRWQWVHRAISGAKQKNAKTLESTEARSVTALPKLVSNAD